MYKYVGCRPHLPDSMGRNLPKSGTFFGSGTNTPPWYLMIPSHIIIPLLDTIATFGHAHTKKKNEVCITFSHVYGMMKNEAVEPPTQCLPSSMLWSRLFSKHVSWFASINDAIEHITTHIIKVISYNPYSTILSPYWKPYHDHIIYQSIYHIIYLYHIMYDTMDHSNVL
jgi:hypothetical protein